MLIAENRIAAMADWIAALPHEVPVYRAAPAVMDTIAGFPIHRGLLGIGLRGPETEPDALLARFPADALVVCCVGITNHDNIGGIFRNAAAFGATCLLLDETCCDPLYRKALRGFRGRGHPRALHPGRECARPALASGTARYPGAGSHPGRNGYAGRSGETVSRQAGREYSARRGPACPRM